MTVGNYIIRQGIADDIQRKLHSGEALTQEEIQYTCRVLEDPLGEFCIREGTFRLVEMKNLDPEKANKLEEEAAEIIRDDLDYNEALYDEFDSDLGDLIIRKTNEGGI